MVTAACSRSFFLMELNVSFRGTWADGAPVLIRISREISSWRSGEGDVDDGGSLLACSGIVIERCGRLSFCVFGWVVGLSVRAGNWRAWVCDWLVFVSGPPEASRLGGKNGKKKSWRKVSVVVMQSLKMKQEVSRLPFLVKRRGHARALRCSWGSWEGAPLSSRPSQLSFRTLRGLSIWMGVPLSRV